jgi:hypothetical protein
MANALGKVFGDIAEAIRRHTGETGKMKPSEFATKINGIEGTVGDMKYYRSLAEAVIMRDAQYFSGDKTTMSMKSFVTSNGTRLAQIAGYSFAGFDEVE